MYDILRLKCLYETDRVDKLERETVWQNSVTALVRFETDSLEIIT